MTQSTLNNIKRIVEYMDNKGWIGKVDLLSSVVKERLTYCEALSETYSDLAAQSVFIAEVKYLGYVELAKNKDNPEMLDSILKKQIQLISEAENKRKEVEDRISELMFILDEYRDRILEMSNLPQTVPGDDETEIQPIEECA